MIHTIREQYLHITINGTEADGLALQARISRLCNDWLMPALEQVLNRYAPTTGHLYMERLEIDAGTLSLERLETDLAQTVAQALEKVIQEQLPSQATLVMPLSGHVQPKTEAQSLDEAFVYFLETGRLPWFFRLTEGHTLEQALLYSWETDPDIRFKKEVLLRTLGADNARKRLLRQFSTHFRDQLLSQIAPAAREVMERIRKRLYASGIEVTAIEQFTGQLGEATWARVARGQAITEEQLISDVWRGLPGIETYMDLQIILEKQGPGMETLKNVVKKQGPGTTSGEKSISDNTLPIEKGNPAPRDFESKEGVYIDNAGLVLLNPFLPQFFEALGLAKEDQLLQPGRALGLLHYLATGQPVAPEYELMLPKILCNIPLEMPVELETTLLDLEKEEATALLEAVIYHWEALRSTTPDGLRGTFLLRPGKLSLRDDGDWRLQVEPMSFDILLDQLPWGISMIKLPWMERMLWVEWS